MDKQNDIEVLTKQQLADLLQVGLETVNYFVYTKQIPRFRCGREYRFVKADIIKWIQKRTENVSDS